jgi:hypothetical protein
MLVIFPRWFLAAAALTLAGPALADTVLMKSGEKIQGKILEESAAEVTVEIREGGVVDRRTLKRGDILTLEKETPDAAAWNAIKHVKTGPTSLTPEQYDIALRPVQAFLAAHPQSPHAEEAKKIATALEEEKKRVEAGEAKVADRWLSAEEAARERFQIDGIRAFNYMRGQAAAGDFIGALNTFEQMEKSYRGARTYPEAVELAKQILASLKVTVDRAAQSLKTDAAGRAQAAPLVRAELEAAVKREDDAGVAAMAAAERAGLKWPPLAVRSDKALTKLTEKITAESKRLAALPIAAIRQSFTVAEGAKGPLAAGDLTAATAALAEAGKLWEPNEIVKRLTAQIAEARNKPAPPPPPPTPVAETKPAEAPKATPPPATPAPVLDRVPVSAPVAAVEEPRPFFATMPGILTVVGGVFAALVAVRIFTAVRSRLAERDDED